MSSPLSYLADNLSKGLHNNKCTDSSFCLGYMSTKDEHLIFMCFECKKNYKKDFRDLIKRCAGIYEFCDGDVKKFMLVLRKEIYPYK